MEATLMRAASSSCIFPREVLCYAVTRLGSLICLAAFFLPLPAADAQTTAGSIAGTVVDPQSALVPNASITARNEG